MEQIALINKLTAQLEMCRRDAKMALSDDWDRSDEGFQAQIDAIDALIGKEEEEGWVFCDGKGCLNGTCAKCVEEMEILDEKQQDAVARVLALEEMAKLQTKDVPEEEEEELEEGYFNDGKEKYYVIKGVKIYSCNCEKIGDIRGRCDPKSKDWDYCLYHVSNTYWWLHNTYEQYEQFRIGGAGGATNREERNKIAFEIAQQKYGLTDGDLECLEQEFDSDDNANDEYHCIGCGDYLPYDDECIHHVGGEKGKRSCKGCWT